MNITYTKTEIKFKSTISHTFKEVVQRKHLLCALSFSQTKMNHNDLLLLAAQSLLLTKLQQLFLISQWYTSSCLSSFRSYGSAYNLCKNHKGVNFNIFSDK